MLKTLLNPKKAERHPLEFIVIGIFYSSLSIFIGSLIFPEYASLIIIFLTSFSCFYVIQGAMKIEEARESDLLSEKNILKKHSKLLKLMIALFIGFVISFALWSLILPSDKSTVIFQLQNQVFGGIQSSKITGNSISNSQAFGAIIQNNLKVLAISFILSLFYGAGSIFIIAWNASIMGFIIGDIAKNSTLFSIPVLFVKYFLHGIPEMLSYITIILAGSILFISFWKKDIFIQGTRKKIIIDIATLIVLSIALIIFSALIEIFISSLI